MLDWFDWGLAIVGTAILGSLVGYIIYRIADDALTGTYR